MSSASHTGVSARNRRLCTGPRAVCSAITSATLGPWAPRHPRLSDPSSGGETGGGFHPKCRVAGSHLPLSSRSHKAFPRVRRSRTCQEISTGARRPPICASPRRYPPPSGSVCPAPGAPHSAPQSWTRGASVDAAARRAARMHTLGEACPPVGAPGGALPRCRRRNVVCFAYPHHFSSSSLDSLARRSILLPRIYSTSCEVSAQG